MTNIDNTEDVIDSRDVVARIEELEAERLGIAEAFEEATDESREELREELEEWDDENGEELAKLRQLAAQGEDYSEDWECGSVLVRDSYFKDYARELLEDCGDIPSELPYYIEIDWEATARNIRMDYSSIEFDGVTYWVR